MRWHRFERWSLFGTGASVFALLLVLLAAGFLPLAFLFATETLALLSTTIVIMLAALFVSDGDLQESYPLVRSDALLLPNPAWISLTHVFVLPWAAIEDLKIEHPKRETGPKWEAGGPDLRISVTTSAGRVVRLSYDGAQDIPWTVHDPLVAALKGAWERRRQ